MVEDVRYKRQLRDYVKQAREESDIQFPAEDIDDAIDLLDLMLTVDPNQRPSAADLLRHPFFTDHPQMVFRWPSFVAGNGQEMMMKENGHQATSKVRLYSIFDDNTWFDVLHRLTTNRIIGILLISNDEHLIICMELSLENPYCRESDYSY